MRGRAILWTAVATVTALALAACGGGDGDADVAASEPTTVATSEPAAAPTTADTSDEAGNGYGNPPRETTTAGSTSVAVASTSLGDVLVDGDGMTLYAFLPDEGASAPTCTDGCAEAWPPLAGPADPGDGVDASMLGTVEHPVGITMTTYAGWPLYRFASDSEPGDVNGQGVGGNWYVMAPDGTLIRE